MSDKSCGKITINPRKARRRVQGEGRPVNRRIETLDDQGGAGLPAKYIQHNHLNAREKSIIMTCNSGETGKYSDALRA